LKLATVNNRPFNSTHLIMGAAYYIVLETEIAGLDTMMTAEK
jgi:hypothetical protein